jgi:hypothetical protein
LESADHNFIPEIREPDPNEVSTGAPDTRRPSVVDTWPTTVPVTLAEIEVTEAYLGDLLDSVLTCKKR